MERKCIGTLDEKDSQNKKVVLVSAKSGNKLALDSMEPLSICCLSSSLLQKGFETKVIHQQPNESNAQVIEKIIAEQPFVVGFSTYASNHHRSLDIAKQYKQKHESKIIFGGYHVSKYDKAISESEGIIDCIVCGEGEETIVKLSKKYLNGESIKGVRGIVYLDENKKIVKTDPCKKYDFSNSAIPDRKDLDLKNYFATGFGTRSIKDQILSSVSTSRGCPHNCDFCVTPGMYAYSARPVDSVVKELEFLVNEKNSNLIFFRDEDFTVNKRRVNELCGEIIQKDLNFEWYSFARIDEVDRDMIKKMKSAGCTDLLIGFESGSPAILKDMNKGYYDIDKVIKTANMIHEEGIRICAMMMVGMPNETKDSFGESIDFLKKIPYHRARLAFTTSFPGCKLYDENKENLYTGDFKKYDGEHIVLKCGIDKGELALLKENSLKELFSSKDYLERCDNYLQKNPEATENYRELFELNHKLYGISIPNMGGGKND